MKSDDDFFISAQTKLRATLADAFKEISALKTELSELKAENSELKFRNKDICEELKDTQAALGRAVVNANRRQVSFDLFLSVTCIKWWLWIQESRDARTLEGPKPHALPVCFQLHLQR